MKKFLAILLALALCMTACASCFASSEKNYILEEGANNFLVTVLQYLLSISGYYADEIDGDFGPVTKAAVEAMQKDFGVEVTGTVDVSNLIGEFDPEAWIDWVIKGGYDLDDEVREILEVLLTADLFDDELPYDFIADLALIALLAEDETPDKDDIATVLAAMIAYAYDYEDEETENADADALYELASLILEDDDEHAEKFIEYLENFAILLGAMENTEDIDDYQNLIITELLDNDDLTDVSVLLHIPAFLADSTNTFEDLAQAYVLLAVVDYLDDFSNSDALEVVDIVKDFDYEIEDGYENFADNAASLLALFSDEDSEEYLELYLELLKADFLDDNKIEDFEEDLFLILLLAEEEYDLAAHLLLSAGILDFADDYDYTDVGIVYEIAKLYAETQNDPEILDTVSRLIEKVA